MKPDSLQQLYLHELEDLHSAEGQLVKALPKMVNAATDLELKNTFSTHLEETKTLGRQDEAEILQETLNEEGACSKLLTQLAEQRLHSLAMATEQHPE